MDPVNFEKFDGKVVEGFSTVYKASIPDLSGHAHLAHGYPAIIATLVNTHVPVSYYANWSSYVIDFISQNNEIVRFSMTGACGQASNMAIALIRSKA